MNFLEAVALSSVLQMALLAAFLASVASGVIGSYVVTRRIVSLSGSIAHSVLSGMGIALWLNKAHGVTWILPLHGALIAAVVAALIIGWTHLRFREREDAIIAMIWSVGMAIGVIFVAKTPGFNVELMHFLLGNILWVSSSDLLLLALLDAIILSAVFLLHKRFLAICFDEKQAQLQGLPVTRLYLLLLVLVAVSVVLLLNVVGIILVLSLLALPPSIAGIFTNRMLPMMVGAFFLSLLFSVGGLALSYKLDLPAGPTIALFAGMIYLISLRFK